MQYIRKEMKEKFIKYIESRDSSKNSGKKYADGIQAISNKYIGDNLFNLKNSPRLASVVNVVLGVKCLYDRAYYKKA